MSCPQPTPQYGQIDRATSASSIRACIARVLSDIASSPVPSARSRICRTSGHLDTKPVSDLIVVYSLEWQSLLISFLSSPVKRKTSAADHREMLALFEIRNL